MKTNASSSHSPASLSTPAPAASFSPDIPHGSSSRSLATKAALTAGRARSHGSQPGRSLADSVARELAIQTGSFPRSSFSDATFARGVLSPDLRSGIALCRRARLVLQAAAVRSFDAGGMELDPVHLRLLLDCAQMCEMTADFMSRNSPYHLYLCEVCAAICEACAESCMLAGSMAECAAICQECIVVCRALAG